MPERALRLAGNVDLALVQALDEVLGRQVDDLDLGGLVDDAVGDGLAHADASDLRDDIVEALEVLHVERGVDVDAGREQLCHVHVPLGMAGARRVRVRELVDEHELGRTLQHGVDIHLLKHMAAVLDAPARNDLEAAQKALRLDAPMGLDHADDNVHPLAPALGRGEQHLVGLADAGRGTEENLELAAALLRGGREQRLWRRAVLAIALVGLAHRTANPAIGSKPRQPESGDYSRSRAARARKSAISQALMRAAAGTLLCSTGR